MRALLLAVAAAVALAGIGCEKLFQKDGERTLEAGDKKVAAGDMRMAIKFYEAALDGTARTAEVHYKLGLIYDDKLNEPVNALHHFERYLGLVPEGKHAKEAKAHRREASLKLAESMNGGAFMTQAEGSRLSKENLQLRMDLMKLRGQKSASTPAPSTGPHGEIVKAPIPRGARTYTVAKGDTLGSIAAKFYKNKARWPKIRDANFPGAKGTPPIKAGDELIIP